jgi:hypothetical protein
VRAVHLELDELLAVDPHRPGGVDLRDDPALELEHAVGRVVRGGRVGLAELVDPLRDVRDGVRVDRADRRDDVLEHVLPVREHVEHDAAAVLGPVVPGRALRLLPVALEDPVAELAAHRQDPAEEAAVHQPLELEQAGQEELVLDHAVLDARGLGQPGQLQGAVERGGGGLLHVDVLARLDRLLERRLAQRGELGVEVDLVGRVRQRRVEVGGPRGQPVPGREGLELVRVAADQDRLGPDDRPVRQGEAALLAQGQDRADQVLAVAHASGDAVHHDAEGGAGHGALPSGRRGGCGGGARRPGAVQWKALSNR